MLSYNFERIFKARGIERPFSYLKQAGFSDGFSTKIKNNKVIRLDLKELEKLCLLLHCSPNDFLEWTPDKGSKVEKEHPIHLIRKSGKVVDITRTLNSIPLNELDNIEQLIQEKLKSTLSDNR